MTQNPPPPPVPLRPPSSSAVACGHCCSDDRWILHNVRLRGLYRKLCSSCVLKLHPTSFCPTCFSLHDSAIATSNTKTLTCFKCSSLSHSTCVPPNAPKSPYLCPPCTNPNHKFFDIRRPIRDLEVHDQSDGGKCSDLRSGRRQMIDERGARVFLAAARIAAVSMSKAVGLAKVDVERKAKESVVAQKRANEAIDHFMVLSSRVSINNPNPNPSTSSAGVRGTNVVPMKVDRNGVVMGRASNGAPPAVVPPPEIKNVGRSNTDKPFSVAVEGQSGTQKLQSNGTTSSDKNHEGGGKDETGA